MHRKGPSRLFGKKPKNTKPKGDGKGTENVHRTNIQVAALPVILVFNVIRILAFQLWVFLSVVCRIGAHALPNKTKQSDRETEKCQEPKIVTPVAEMVNPSPGKAGGLSVGPGEPALAKQKHHHRKAFEYISKALKIDEEDKGEY
jgi:spastin